MESLSVYSHLAKFSSQVKEGDTIQTGQFIPKSGGAGYASGTHLHFEMLQWKSTDEGVKKFSVPVKFRLIKKGKVSVPLKGNYYKRRQ